MAAARAVLDFDPRRFDPSRPPVLLLGGLNILRPLGQAGIPAIVAASDAGATPFASRYCSGRCVLPPLEHRDAALAALAEVGERLSSALGTRVPLMYGNDEGLELVQDAREQLSAYFRFVLNDPDVAHALIAKDRFEALAQARGLPIPRALEWDELARFKGSVLAKPRSKVGFEETPLFSRLFGGSGKAKVYACAADVLDDPVARQLGDKLVFQEYVTGTDRCLYSFHGFADEDARLLGWFTGRKIRTAPALTGASTYLELARDGALAELGRQVVERVPLKGPFKIDFKRDAKTGRLYVLEVNARYNLWHYLGAANGLNLPALAYDYVMRGERPAKTAFSTHTRWLCLPLDVRAYRDLAGRGELGALRWIASIVLWRKVYDHFSWSDPLPSLLDLRERVLRVMRSAPARVLSQFRRWRSTAS